MRVTESQNARGWKGPLWVIFLNPPIATSIFVVSVQGGRTVSSKVCTEGGFKYHGISLLA